jgi:hypothetical protein
MTKNITQFTAQLVTFETSLPISEVCSRLDQKLHKSKAGQIFNLLRSAKSKEEIVDKINEITGGGDFLYVINP